MRPCSRRSFRSVLAACTALSAIVAPGLAVADDPYPLVLAPFESYNVGHSTTWVAAGDVDGDGHLDLVSPAYGVTSLLRGRGDGSFVRHVALPYSMNPAVLGDLDGDGDLDLVGTSGSALRVVMNAGGGAFGPTTGYPGNAIAIALADLNEDGRLDVVSTTTTAVSVYLGLGAGALGAPSTTAALFTTEADIAVGDIDGDGHVDVAVPHARGLSEHPCWSQLFGNGDGTLDPPVGVGSCGIGHPFTVAIVDLDGSLPAELTGDLAIADLNGDGRMDRVGGYVSVAMTVELGLPGGGFGPIASYWRGSNLSNAVVGDFDEDGDLDILATHIGCNPYTPSTCGPDTPFPTTLTLSKNAGDGTFAGGGSTMNVGGPRATAIGDLSGDGGGDLVIAHGSALTVRLGDGDGGLAPGVPYAVAGALGVAIADVDGDAFPDLVSSASTGTTVLRGLGAGVFGDRRDNPMASEFGDFVLADMNGDGRLDLVAASFGGIGVALGNGDATFGPATYTTPSASTHLAVGRINGDAFLDVVATHTGGGEVRSWLGNGAGGFSSSVVLVAGPPVPFFPFDPVTDVAAGDFDGDGFGDAAYAFRQTTPSSTFGYLVLRRGNGTGNFGPQQLIETGSQPVHIAVADMDANGILDLVSADGISGSVSVVMRTGIGAFDKWGYGGTAAPSHVSAGDLNGDGRPDLAVTHAAANAVSVFLSPPKDGPTPVLLAGFRAERVAAGVAVWWRFESPGRVASSRLERSASAAGPWTAVETGAGAAGEVSWIDSDAAGDRWYRLVAREANGAETRFGPLFVAAARITDALSLAVSPNPSVERVQLEWALPAEGRVRLVVIDLQGREVARLADGDFAAGPHRVGWGSSDAGARAAGVYFARLETAYGVVTRRFVRAR